MLRRRTRPSQTVTLSWSIGRVALVGQIGVLVAPNGGMVAVALAAPPDSGKFDDDTADLTMMAGWLNANLEALPTGQCSL